MVFQPRFDTHGYDAMMNDAFKYLLRLFFDMAGLTRLTVAALLIVLPGSGANAVSEKFSVVEQDQLTRLKAIGFGEKPEVYIRIFKEEKELEVWVNGGSKYKLFRNVPICKYSGKLGPKLAEGDRQAPEGFYHVPAQAVLWNSAKWPRALNIAFPNVFDAANKRTGSKLLIHGGCSSRGCYALKDGPMEEVYSLVSLAVKKGQKYFPIHIFPFRFSEKNWLRHKDEKAYKFWQTLQPGYERFNRTRKVPKILVCGGKYKMPMFGRLLNDDTVFSNNCVRPIPISFVRSMADDLPRWVVKVADEYPKIQHAQRKPDAPRIKVSCNLRRPSCKKWLALRKRMLARGTLPKNLLNSSQ